MYTLTVLFSFKEFLKKEFSHENIYFWAACERYKDTKDVPTRRRLACQIYQRHLSSTAAEPVNVDSHASGQITQELLDEAPADLFLQVRIISKDCARALSWIIEFGTCSQAQCICCSRRRNKCSI